MKAGHGLRRRVLLRGGSRFSQLIRRRCSRGRFGFCIRFRLDIENRHIRRGLVLVGLLRRSFWRWRGRFGFSLRSRLSWLLRLGRRLAALGRRFRLRLGCSLRLILCRSILWHALVYLGLFILRVCLGRPFFLRLDRMPMRGLLGTNMPLVPLPRLSLMLARLRRCQLAPLAREVVTGASVRRSVREDIGAHCARHSGARRVVLTQEAWQ